MTSVMRIRTVMSQDANSKQISDTRDKCFVLDNRTCNWSDDRSKELCQHNKIAYLIESNI